MTTQTIEERMADLEAKIVNGEAWLANAENLGNEKYDVFEKWYWKYVEEWCVLDLKAHDTIVTLALPPNVGWQRDNKSVVYRTARVRFWSEPQAADEMTRDDLAALLEDVKLKKEAML